MYQLFRFRQFVIDSDVRAVVAAYPSLSDARLLGPNDTLDLVQSLHNAIRSEYRIMAPESIHRCVCDCVERLKSRRLPPHPLASMHLISCFKETRHFDLGIDLWSWLVEQDNKYVDLRTYGAAIELLAASGQSLSYCEEVYSHGLKRFSQGFNRYHMSPGSLLQSRDQPADFPKTSMTLIQGIIKARLIYGDWVHAYQGLDTALRLHPTQIPTGMFRIFLNERPIPEAYHLFCLLCQAGNLVRPKDLTYLLMDLASTQNEEIPNEFTLKILMAMLNAIHYYVGSGQRINVIHLNTLMHSCLKLLPVRSISNAKPSRESHGLAMDLVTRLLTIFATLRVEPIPSTYGILVRAAGRTRDEVILNQATDSLSAFSSRLDSINFRTLLWAVSRISHAARVESLWKWHVHQVSPAQDEWFALAKATSLTRNHDFLQKQLKLHPSVEGSQLADIVRTAMEQTKDMELLTEPTPHVGTSYIPLVRQLNSALDAFNELIANSEYRNLKAFPPKSMSIHSDRGVVEEEWQKKLYDEMTVDPTITISRSQKTDLPDEESTQHDSVTTTFVGPTGFGLGEIRYRHWKGINELFQLAEVFEARIQASVKKAIEEGTAAKVSRSTNLARTRIERTKIATSLLLEHFHDRERMRANPLNESEWREKILAFRRVKDEERIEASEKTFEECLKGLER